MLLVVEVKLGGGSGREDDRVDAERIDAAGLQLLHHAVHVL
jgi:hypothetical protein